MLLGTECFRIQINRILLYDCVCFFFGVCIFNERCLSITFILVIINFIFLLTTNFDTFKIVVKNMWEEASVKKKIILKYYSLRFPCIFHCNSLRISDCLCQTNLRFYVTCINPLIQMRKFSFKSPHKMRRKKNYYKRKRIIWMAFQK